MANLRSAIQLTDGMTPALRSMSNALNIVINSFATLQSQSSHAIDTNSIQAARSQLAQAEVQFNQIEQEIREANGQQQNFNASVRGGSAAAGGLIGKIKGYVGAYVGFMALRKGMDETDEYTNQSARLGLINDKLQTQEQLQQKVFNAAQRSRSAYGDTVNAVAKLGLLAGDAFKGNDETIRFAELMNKSFKISGASIQESTAGMYQLTQAMAAGKLQGDEFRSIMENAPMLAQAIAKFTGKSKGQLKDMSKDGTITANIIKSALFSAADDIEAKFKKMPVTFGTAWVMIKNNAVMQFSGIMESVNKQLNSVDGKQTIQGISNAIGGLAHIVGGLLTTVVVVASFFRNNWSIISPIVWGIVIAYTAFNAVLLAHNIIMSVSNGLKAISAARTAWAAASTLSWATATKIATEANLSLNTVLMANPIAWIIGLVLAAVVAFYVIIAVINKFAHTSYSATGIIVGAFAFLFSVIINIGMATINAIIDIIGIIWNFIASFAEFIANVFIDPVGSVVRLFSSMADTILSIFKGMTGIIDTITGSKFSNTIQNLRDKLESTTVNVVGEAKIKVPRMDTSRVHLKGINLGDAYNSGYNLGKNVESKLDPSNLFGNKNKFEDNVSNIAANTNDMKNSVSSSKEDLKYLRDIASRQAINRFTTAKIKVDMTNHNSISSDMDLDGVVAHLEKKVHETMTASAEGTHK